MDEELQATFTELGSAITGIEEKLQPLLQLPLKQLSAQLSHKENAKLHVTLGYAINALYFMFLKTQGVAPMEHPVKEELARIRGYIQKVQEMEKGKAKPKSKIDVAASQRFIKNALASGSAARQEKQLGTSKGSPAKSSSAKGKGKAKAGSSKRDAASAGMGGGANSTKKRQKQKKGKKKR